MPRASRCLSPGARCSPPSPCSSFSSSPPPASADASPPPLDCGAGSRHRRSRPRRHSRPLAACRRTFPPSIETLSRRPRPRRIDAASTTNVVETVISTDLHLPAIPRSSHLHKPDCRRRVPAIVIDNTAPGSQLRQGWQTRWRYVCRPVPAATNFQ